MTTLPKKYDHAEIERARQLKWEENGVYRWNENAPHDENFVVDTPPPTVSGLLHMGHVFSYVQADFVARYRRMKGENVFYPMGFDDNGLPTERLVEKVKKIRAHAMPREEFIAVCEQVSEDARKEFRSLFTSVALSVDWRQEYHTISRESRALSQMSFIDLLEKQQAYRRLQPMFWDVIDRTAIAQAETEDKELSSHFCDVAFTVQETDERVVIGTTRPELIGACVSVFYHPDDERYAHLAGKHAVTALFGAIVPFIADDAVKIDKGTGLVMCCTFGDETDVMWREKHNLPLRVIVGKDGKIHNLEGLGDKHVDTGVAWPCVDRAAAASVIVQLNGQKIDAARALTIELLDAAGLLLKKEPIVHAVKCAERSGAPLEILPTEQWFIKILEHKDALKKKADAINWRPAYMKKRLEQWIDGLSWDWCISRQRYYGVPFPVWYSRREGEEGKILAAHPDDLPVNPLVDLPRGYSKEEVSPDADVMDTWATSSLSPQLNSHAVSGELGLDLSRHAKLYPASVRPQAHEIIRTWAFYTIVKSYLHNDDVPWTDVMVSGWCLAADKTKMSKSKGNVVTPEDLIRRMGADTVRYWASTSRLGADTAYSEDVLKIGKKLTGKIFNAAKFVAMQFKDGMTPTTPAEDVKSGAIFCALDLWALSRLSETVEKAQECFERFEYSEARTHIEDYFWNVFCDNYLELAKVRAYGEEKTVDVKASLSASLTFYHCLETLLRLFAPFMPHLCDEIYDVLFLKDGRILGGSVHARGNWPQLSDHIRNEKATASGVCAVAVIDAVRKLKAEKGVSIKWPLDSLCIEKEESRERLGDAAQDVAFAANVSALTFNCPDNQGETQEGSEITGKISALFAKESDRQAS